MRGGETERWWNGWIKKKKKCRDVCVIRQGVAEGLWS